MNRILIVNVNWVGDVLFSTPLIRAVREKFPTAHIACMLVQRCREVLELNPHLNEIIIYDEENAHRGLAGKLKFIGHLRRKRFDTAIFLHRSFTRGLIVFLAGVRERIGYYTKKRSFLLTKPLAVPDEEKHRVDFFLNLAGPLGILPKNRNYEFFVSDEDRKAVKEYLRNQGVRDSDAVIAINPGGNWEPKRWPAEMFAGLADMLQKRFKAKIVITGAKKDVRLAEYISSRMEQKPVILCGKTSLKELGALFERATLAISGDSGPLHIAVSMGTRAIALFGPTLPQITGPIGKSPFVILQGRVDCEVPCYDLSCRDYRCMKDIKVQDVLKASEKLMAL